MTKHTPGPWRLREWEDYDGKPRISVDADIDPTFEFRGLASVAYDKGDAELMANALLIAAAPDLLAELRSLRNEITGVWGAFEHEIRASISNTNYQVMLDKLDAANAAIAKAEP